MPFARAPFCRFANPTKLQTILHFCRFDAVTTSGGDYTNPPWPTAFSTVFPSARLDAVVAAGFDGCRFTTRVGPLMKAASDSVLDTRIAVLTTAMSSVLAKGLKVILSLYPPPSDELTYGTLDVISGGVNGTAWQRYIYCAVRLAAALEALNKSGMILFELFNQVPVTSQLTEATWPQYQNALFAAVRAAAPRLTIGAVGSNGSAYDGIGTGTSSSAGLNQLTLSDFDANTVLCAQDYDMTHPFHSQHTGGELDQLQGLTWPASAHPGGIAAAKASWTAGLDAALAAHTIDQATHDDRINTFVNGSSHSYCLFRAFNEFGAKSGLTASHAERLKIITDKMDLAGWSRKQLGSTEAACNFQFANCMPKASAMQLIQDWRDNHAAAGTNFITIFQGGDVNETLTNGTENAIVQSGVSPYAFESGFLEALRLK